MSYWVITSWVFVFVLTGINIVIFLKLKGASEQMMKMVFPGANNMAEALDKMQAMTGAMQARGGRGPYNAGGRGSNPQMDAQLKAAMDMLQNMKKK